LGQQEELRLLSLAPAELRLLLALRHLANRWREVNATMEELSNLTGYSRTTLWRAHAGLETAGFIDTTRTKRNFGFYARNRYVLSLGFMDETSQDDACFTDGTSQDDACFTDGTSTSNIDIASITTKESNNTIKAINTSCLLGAAGTEEEKMVNRWSEEDDNIGGFGLLEGEVPSTQKAKPISKRDPKTRHQRPQDEWTAADVASEFASRIYSKVRGVPGLVNTNALRGALAANRSRFNITATIEMEVMERFFADERNMATIRKAPSNSHGMFLRAITNNVQQVVEDFGMEDNEVVDEPEITSYVYASDGKSFDNSMPGRAALARYEKKLKG